MLRRCTPRAAHQMMLSTSLLERKELERMQCEAVKHHILAATARDRARWTSLPPGFVNGSAVQVDAGIRVRPKRKHHAARCDHVADRSRCRVCNTASFGSSQICVHGRRKTRCVDCGSSGGAGSVCQHGRNRDKCNQCQTCDHGNRRAKCGHCKCPHGFFIVKCTLCS